MWAIHLIWKVRLQQCLNADVVNCLLFHSLFMRNEQIIMCCGIVWMIWFHYKVKINKRIWCIGGCETETCGFGHHSRVLGWTQLVDYIAWSRMGPIPSSKKKKKNGTHTVGMRFGILNFRQLKICTFWFLNLGTKSFFTFKRCRIKFSF